MSRSPDPAAMVAVATAPARARFWNVPNALTVGRLALAVVVFALIGLEQYALALFAFVIAALSDALDGYFARLLQQSTAVGRQLDPLVDKVINSAGYIYLLTVPNTGLEPWMDTTIIVRELLIQGLRSHLEGQGQPFGARWAGKLKTVFQCLSIAAILLSLAIHPPPSWLLVRDALTWTAVALTLYSGLGYVALALPRLRGASPRSAP